LVQAESLIGLIEKLRSDMEDLFASGQIIDFILILVGFEAAAILVLRVVKGIGPAPLPFLINLVAGASLMLALRNALVGAQWTWIAPCLIVSLGAHLSDLLWRWERKSRNPSSAPKAQTATTVD